MISGYPASQSIRSRPLQGLLALARPALLPFVASRSIILLFAGLLSWLLDGGWAYRYAFIGDAPLAPLSATFDANWYASVAADGYSTSANLTQPQNYHFFPLYPFFMRLLGNLLGLDRLHGGYGVAGVVLSHLFFFAALALLYKLTVQVWGDEGLANRAIWAMAVLPWSYVFSMAYTEALFLALALGAMVVAYGALVRPQAADGMQALSAGLLASLAALTRPQGFAVALAAAYLLAVAPRSLGLRARVRNALLAGAPAVVAVATFAVYIALRTGTGNMLALSQVTGVWGRGWLSDLPRVFVLPPANPLWFVDTLSTVGLVTWAFLTAALLGRLLFGDRKSEARDGPGVVGPEAWGFVLYACAYFAAPLLQNPMNLGWGRYLLVAFPCIWVVAWGVHRASHARRLAMVSMALQVLLFAAVIFQQVTP